MWPATMGQDAGLIHQLDSSEVLLYTFYLDVAFEAWRIICYKENVSKTITQEG